MKTIPTRINSNKIDLSVKQRFNGFFSQNYKKMVKKTAKQKLIEYMEAIEDISYKKTNIKGNYFKKADKEIIETWREIKCLVIWCKIRDLIKIFNKFKFSNQLCPFCFYYENNCYICRYRNNHNKECEFGYKDYIKHAKKITITLKQCKNLIKKIEK